MYSSRRQYKSQSSWNVTHHTSNSVGERALNLYVQVKRLVCVCVTGRYLLTIMNLVYISAVTKLVIPGLDNVDGNQTSEADSHYHRTREREAPESVLEAPQDDGRQVLCPVVRQVVPVQADLHAGEAQEASCEVAVGGPAPAVSIGVPKHGLRLLLRVGQEPEATQILQRLREISCRHEAVAFFVDPFPRLHQLAHRFRRFAPQLGINLLVRPPLQESSRLVLPHLPGQGQGDVFTTRSEHNSRQPTPLHTHLPQRCGPPLQSTKVSTVQSYPRT